MYYELLFLVVLFSFVAYQLWGTRSARYTRELSKINRLMERLNDAESIEVIDKIAVEYEAGNWRYCKKQASMLEFIIKLKVDRVCKN